MGKTQGTTHNWRCAGDFLLSASRSSSFLDSIACPPNYDKGLSRVRVLELLTCFSLLLLLLFIKTQTRRRRRKSLRSSIDPCYCTTWVVVRIPIGPFLHACARPWHPRWPLFSFFFFFFFQRRLTSISLDDIMDDVVDSPLRSLSALLVFLLYQILPSIKKEENECNGANENKVGADVGHLLIKPRTHRTVEESLFSFVFL